MFRCRIPQNIDGSLMRRQRVVIAVQLTISNTQGFVAKIGFCQFLLETNSLKCPSNGHSSRNRNDPVCSECGFRNRTRAIEAFDSIQGGKSAEAFDPPAWSAQEPPQLRRTAFGNYALLPETSPSADEKLIGKC